ncbi:MAG TPA: PLP-dependent aminotransferase family protein [Actinoplanes sp.]|jgi:GntR family transcriptional regulator/MocR family aminotransferase|nr:PLP-dependent aminotransferase family protein [Actinoplanes sp.]
MRIPVDRDSAVPVYRQVELWLRASIEDGALPAGTRLPASRALAAELGLSRITVVNAYAALEGDGLLVTRTGSGTFVEGRGGGPPLGAGATEWPLWQRMLPVPEKVTEPAWPVTDRPDLISFTGVGDTRLFPVKELQSTMGEVLRQAGTAALDYGSLTDGYHPLQETICQLLASQGIRTAATGVVVTSGSQQALALVCQVLLTPGDTVLVEQPTYNLALDLFRVLRLRPVGIPVDRSGMRVELVERALQQHHPRLIYTIPNFQNPTGACLSGERRHQLLALARRYNVPILEDDYAGDLRYEGRSQPAIKALDPGGHVIYVGTFAKLLMPGLRVGYLVADGPVRDLLATHKRAQDLTTSPLMQRIVDRYVTVGRYQAHLRRTTRLYRRRRDALLTALAADLPEVAVEPPTGGLFAWLRLPPGVTGNALLPIARAEGVEFAPGDAFFPDPADGAPFIRLNFATRTPEEIALGVTRLGAALRRFRGAAGVGDSGATPNGVGR